MRSSFKYLFVVFLLVQGGESPYLQGQVPGETPDWSVPQSRAFDTLALNGYKSDPAFQYGAVRQFNESLWSRIKRWFWNKLDELFGTNGSVTGMIIFFSFLGLGVVALLYYLIRIRDISPFRRADRKAAAHAVLFDEKIEPEDLDRKIREAKEGANYRMAVRYLTIRMFHELEQAGSLDTDPSTTMDQYRQKLRNSPFSSQFDALTRYFEFVWYGEYALSNEDFSKIERRFEQFSETLKK